jgi:poly-gamma-glutamate capsule biosynthesis protein CapA/YwtB (metallophosphatase superfamily)
VTEILSNLLRRGTAVAYRAGSAIILTGVERKKTRRTVRLSDRRLLIPAVVLCLAAAAIAGLYIADRRALTPSTEALAESSAVSTSGPTTTKGTAPTGSHTGASIPDSATATSETAASSITTSITATSSTTTSTTMTSTTTTSTTEAPAPALTVAASGDVLGDRKVGSFVDKNGGEAVFAKVGPLLEAAQLAFVNLESPLSERGTPDPHKEYTFLGRPALADGLTSAGIDVVSLANNHAVDYGPAALLDTIRLLDELGVNHAGAGADAQAARAPALLITPAGIVAVLAFTELIHPGFPATSDRPGINPVTPDRKRLLADISAAKKKADFVIVSFHWGTEYTGRANQDQRRLAHQAIDAGADLILGHHPHVIQGLELYKDRLIAYSMGDFVWDHNSRETGETFVLHVALTADGPPTVDATPVYLDDATGVPAPVTGREAETILNRLIRLSAELGLELTREEDRAIYAPGATPTVVAPAP